MSEIKHTPVFHGPFEYVPGTENHGPYVTNSVGNTICDCYVMSRLPNGEFAPFNFCGEMAEDYARLIAAAPELLEALTAAREHLEWSTPQGQDAMVQIVNAIAKAEGRS